MWLLSSLMWRNSSQRAAPGVHFCMLQELIRIFKDTKLAGQTFLMLFLHVVPSFDFKSIGLLIKAASVHKQIVQRMSQ